MESCWVGAWHCHVEKEAHLVVTIVLVGVGGEAIERVCVLERLVLVHVLDDLQPRLKKVLEDCRLHFVHRNGEPGREMSH